MKNKKLMKVVAAATIAAMSLGVLAGCGSSKQPQKEEQKVYKIGVVQLMQHSALDLANEGLIAGLKDAGFEEGVNVEYDQQNGQGDQSNLQSIAQQFLANEVDMILSIATPSTQVMANATEEIPIVGTAITSFVSAGLVDSDEHPGRNVTGTHDMTPIAEQVDLIQQILPDAKTIGTIYTSSEKNSQVQVDILKAVCEERGLTVVERTISNVNDIQQATQSIVSECDVLWLSTDNNVASSMPQVVSVTDEVGMIVVCGEEGMVNKGGTITYGINFFQIGYDAGQMAAKILKGEATPAEMPIQGPTGLNLVINKEAVDILGLELPEEITANATWVNE